MSKVKRIYVEKKKDYAVKATELYDEIRRSSGAGTLRYGKCIRCDI